MPLPFLSQKLARQLQDAGVEDVGVLEHLVVVVVLGRQAERARLHAHVDVLRHQDHVAVGVAVLQPAHHAEDLVVGLAHGQAGRQRRLGGLRLEEQAPGGVLVAERGQRDAVLDRPSCRRRPASRACGTPGARCAPPRSCPSCARRVLPASSSAGRCRAPRSGTGSSGRAAARSCRARRASASRSSGPCGRHCAASIRRRPAAWRGPGARPAFPGRGPGVPAKSVPAECAPRSRERSGWGRGGWRAWSALSGVASAVG